MKQQTAADDLDQITLDLREEGLERNIHGAWKTDEKGAKEDLESMRAAASGMGREDGLAAMAAEADRLKAGKAPKEEGSVKRLSDGFAALTRWMDGGEDEEK